MHHNNTQNAPIVRPTPTLIGWFTNLACYLFAAVAVIYMSVRLYGYMQIDPIGYLPECLGFDGAVCMRLKYP